jgi:hypothetical protein
MARVCVELELGVMKRTCGSAGFSGAKLRMRDAGVLDWLASRARRIQITGRFLTCCDNSVRACLKMHLVIAETCEHEANHGQVDHGFARGSFPFVVATESAGTAQPTESTLHDPTPRQYLEGVELGALHDFDRAATHLACPFQEPSGVASIGPDMFDASARPLAEECGQQMLGSIPVLNVGWQNHDQENQTDRVDQDVSFAPVDFLACIVAPLVAGFGALDALAVDDRSAGLRLASFDQAEMFSQMRVNLVQQAIALPESEVVIDRTPRSKVLGQVAPLAAGFDEVEDRVEQLAERMLAGAALLAGLGEAVVDELPFGIGKIRCVSHRQCVTGCGTMYKPSLTKS